MGVLVTLLVIIITLTIFSIFCTLRVSGRISRLEDQKEIEKVIEEAKVTDPFNKPKEIYSSTSHIVVPKTPTEIRNLNFKKIKEGIEYGDITKR